MAKRKAPKFWTEEIANLDDRAPQGIKVSWGCIRSDGHANHHSDFDPEESNDEVDNEERFDSDDSEESHGDAREHYENIAYGISEAHIVAAANLLQGKRS